MLAKYKHVQFLIPLGIAFVQKSFEGEDTDEQWLESLRAFVEGKNPMYAPTSS